MRKLFILHLAFKNLKGRKLRTGLTIGGVSLGIGFVVFLISLGTGLQRISTSEIANLEALSIMDVTSGKSKIITINDETLDKFKKIGDIEKISPSISLPGRLNYKTSSIDLVVYAKNSDYLEMEDLKLEKGQIYSSNNNRELLINTAALNQLGLKDLDKSLNESLKISFTVRSDLLASKKPKKVEETFTIKGVIGNDSAPYVYLPLDFIKNSGAVKYTNVKLKVGDKDQVDTVKQKIENLGYKVSAIKNTVDQINQFFNIFQIILVSFGLVGEG